MPEALGLMPSIKNKQKNYLMMNSLGYFLSNLLMLLVGPDSPVTGRGHAPLLVMLPISDSLKDRVTSASSGARHRGHGKVTAGHELWQHSVMPQTCLA